jgi:hypothetical protein
MTGSIKRSVLKSLAGLVNLAGSLLRQFLGDITAGDCQMVIVRANRCELQLITGGAMTIVRSGRVTLRMEVVE